jgi:hypothetical protein
VYLLDSRGEHLSVTHAPDRILDATISDDGTLAALLVAGSRLVLLSAGLEVLADRSAPPDSQALAVDPHGRYILVASKICLNQFYTRHGRPAGKFETRQALAHLAFVPDRPFLLGAAAFGSMLGIELRTAGSSGRLAAEVEWEEPALSNVGRLTTSGDGGMVLASCYTHGVQRYDLQGRNEGAYHLGGTAAHAVSDFPGRMIAVATLEGELVILSPGGQVRWRTGLTRPAVALEADALGRFVIYGQATGEVVRVDLEPSSRPAPAAARSPDAIRPGAGGGGTSRSVRKPDWTVVVVPSEEQAETAVLAVLDDPGRIGLLTRSNRLQVFNTKGRSLGAAPEILGVGRILRTAPGWITAATDRQIALLDARRNAALRIDVSLVEVTHLVIRPDSFGLAIVQERDRVGRVTPAGRWVWKSELASPVEDIAIGPDGHAAFTMESGRLDVLDPAGNRVGGYSADPSEPLCLIDAPDLTPEPVVWVSLARRSQVLRGHDLLGRVIWQTPVAWEPWQLQRVGPLAVVSAPDGRALAIDGGGIVRASSRATEGGSEVFGATAEGEPWRATRQGVHLICSDFSGRVHWRTVADEPLGPFAASQSGVAILIGRSLAWFSFQPTPSQPPA